MAKFTLNDNSVFTIDGNALTCVIDISFDESVNDIVAECFGADDYVEHVLGGVTVSGSANLELETDDVIVLGYIAPKTSGQLVCQPNGTTAGDIKITSSNLQVTQRTVVSAARSSLATASFSFVCDDLTVAANSA